MTVCRSSNLNTHEISIDKGLFLYEIRDIPGQNKAFMCWIKKALLAPKSDFSHEELKENLSISGWQRDFDLLQSCDC